MKRAFKFYLIAWAIMFVIFNVVVIALPKETTIAGITYTKLGGLSWITLILFELCFVGHLVCTWFACKQNKLTGTFYRLPLIRLSYACVIVTLVLGCLAMTIPNLPSWIPLVLTLAVMAIYVFAILKAAAAAEIASSRTTSQPRNFAMQWNCSEMRRYSGSSTDSAPHATIPIFFFVRKVGKPSLDSSSRE